MTRDVDRPRPPRSAVAVALALALGTTAAHAQTMTPTIKCVEGPMKSKVIYVAGSSAIRPFLNQMAKLVAADGYGLVYQSQGSCTGVAAVFDDSKRLIKDITGNYAILLTPDGVNAQECWLDANGNTVDIGASDVQASTCGYPTTPADIGDYEGPIQPMTLVVPSASTQRVISAEAAYFVFGTGANRGQIAPWTDPSLYFVRNASSGTQQMIAKAIGVPADRWWGVNRGSSSAVRDGLKVVLDPARAEKAIGVLSTDVADEERANLRILAFQAYGQVAGFLPDSTPFATDKRNVRDGHYAIWAPVHFFTRLTASLPSPAATAFVSRFSAARLDQALLETIIKRHLVPKCAMRVSRAEEQGPMKPYDPDSQCHCYFDLVASGATKCQPCTGPASCPKATPACNYGYCERK